MTALRYFTTLLVIIPVFLYGDIIIVDQNGTGYSSIQEGINNANTGDTVLVYPGNYIEIVDFTGKDLVVASLFLTTQDTTYITQTIIDGNNENYRLVRFTNGESENARLIGFTITNASSGKAKKDDSRNSQGLGIYINGSSPVIENNYIINNSYSDWYYVGGGIVIENSSAKILNNIISNNDMAYHGGGIYINNSVNVLIENNSIDSNMVNSGYGVSFGAGIHIDSSYYITIRNNSICNNYNNFGYGGGIYLSRSDHIKILNNNISNNINRRNGGGIYTISSSDISIIGNLLYNNHARSVGGGIYYEDSEILMANNSICFNKADNLSNFGKGGGIYCLNSNPVIHNTILFSNTAVTSGDQVYLDANSDPDFFYSNIEGGLSAFGLADTVVYNGLYENNIETDPQFMLSGDHPYNLEIISPCINAGNPDTIGLNIPEFDLAGNIRIVQDTIDIGAYECQFTSNIAYSYKSNDILIFPNPAKDKLTIRIPETQFQKAWATLTDVKGNLILKFQIENPIEEYDLSSLPRGIYIMKIVSGKLIRTEKIILY